MRFLVAAGGELHVGMIDQPPWAITEGEEVVAGVEVVLAARRSGIVDARRTADVRMEHRRRGSSSSRRSRCALAVVVGR
jgi:hypothetical protein